jgi:2-oxo-3-hexenedioate decarboxylase
MTSELQALADRQWRDYRGREPGTCFSDLGFTLDLARAYELQDAVTALRISAGDRFVGYKVGCTGQGPCSSSAWRDRSAAASSKVKCGDIGRRWISMTSQVWRSKARWPCGWGQMARSRLSSPSSSCTTSSSGGSGRTLGELVANNGLNGGFVLPLEGWLSSQDYVERRGVLSIRINGRLIASGELWPLPGGVRASLEWLRNHLAEAGLALLPGQIVLASTPLGLYPVLSGDHVAVFVNDEIGVQCSVR